MKMLQQILKIKSSTNITLSTGSGTKRRGRRRRRKRNGKYSNSIRTLQLSSESTISCSSKSKSFCYWRNPMLNATNKFLILTIVILVRFGSIDQVFSLPTGNNDKTVYFDLKVDEPMVDNRINVDIETKPPSVWSIDLRKFYSNFNGSIANQSESTSKTTSTTSDNYYYHPKKNPFVKECNEKFIVDNGEEEDDNDDNEIDSNLAKNIILKKRHQKRYQFETVSRHRRYQHHHRRDIRDISESKEAKQGLLNKVFSIETIIFVDQSLIYRFNGAQDKLEKLIMAIMDEAQLIYNFDSMNIRIRIVVKKIVYLNERQNSPDPANGDIDQYLDNFCLWQKRLWQRANQTSKWDHALMLTGLDLFKQVGHKKNKKVLGLAWVNGMCKPSYSCTLNEGKNFEAAFVIAHELAHSLGILHDGYDNNCDPDRYIMSEKTGPGKINWSPCSNMYLENFLTKSNMKCLEKNHDDTLRIKLKSALDYLFDNRLPGEQYTLNQQCQLALGNEYRAYTTNKHPFNNVCQELWCASGTWATPAHPALEGSRCGLGKSCYQGQCVTRRNLFTQNKQDTYYNRHLSEQNSPPMVTPSGGSNGANSGSNWPQIASTISQPESGESSMEGDNFTPKVTNSSSSNQRTSNFMRKVQGFLRTTVGSIVKFFTG